MSSLRVRLASGPGAPVSPELYRAGLAWYDSIVAALAVANPDSRAWWYNWLSCRDLFNNRLTESLALVLSAQDTHQDFACPDHRIAAAVAADLGSRNVAAARPLGARWAWWAGSFAEAWRQARQLIAEARRQLRWIGAARRQSRLPDDASTDVVLVTLFHQHNLPRQGAAYSDNYFGSLPAAIKVRGLQPLLVGDSMDAPEAVLPRLAGNTDVPLLTYYSFVTPFDVAACLARALLSRVRLPDVPSLANPGVRAVVRHELNRSRPLMARIFLIERAMMRLLARQPTASVLLMCENNCWERAVVFATHAAGRALTGYMHNPIFPGNRKLSATPAEWNIRPDPDRVICTGPAAREALLKLGGYPPNRVVPGCALRVSFDARRPPVSSGDVRRLLVLMNGLPMMDRLLTFLDTIAPRLPDVRIVVRGHPNSPVERLASLARVKVGPDARLEICRAATLSDALDDADCVIYASSGAAFVAAARGLPLLYFRRDPATDEDPLFMRPDLREVIDTADDIVAGIARINARAPDARREHSAALAAYARDYMTPPDEISLAPFWTGQGAASSEARRLQTA